MERSQTATFSIISKYDRFQHNIFQMNGRILDNQTKTVTNATLLAFSLTIAAHFAAPSLLDFFGLSLQTLSSHPFVVLKFVTAGLTERNPWHFILTLCPHFTFGFLVETVLGSGRFAVALTTSTAITNGVTIALALFLNRFVVEVLPWDYVFVSSTPVVLLCLWAFILLVPANARFLRFARGTLLVALLGITFLCVFLPLIYVINFFCGLIINFWILHWFDSGITFSRYARAGLPPDSVNDENYQRTEEADETAPFIPLKL
jgi:hypothetical protein